jgi:hypothetical protein
MSHEGFVILAYAIGLGLILGYGLIVWRNLRAAAGSRQSGR